MLFTAKKNEKINKLLNNKDYLFELTESYGDLLNIIIPENIEKNIAELKNCFKKHRIKASIYYAHKCNHSSSIVNEMLNNEISIDVASVNELKHALSVGFSGKNIEATGPKNADFILLGLRHNILFNVDNIDELKTIIAIHNKLKKVVKTNVLIRLNNFSSRENVIINKQSRFGSDINNINEILDIIINNKSTLDLKGFSFHLDTVSVKERVIAIENIINVFQKCYALDLNPSVINIGGGLKVNYIENEGIWNDGISSLKENILNNSSDLWNNNKYGLVSDKNILKGSLNVSNYFDNTVKADFLDEILSYRLINFENRKVGEILSDNMIELMIEPGKSLLDNVGINVVKVLFTKVSPNKDILVGLDMNRSNLLIGDQEMLVDPVLISKTNETSKNDGVFLIGNLCMENDIIFKRKIKFDKIPQKNDLIVFINTAGYFMDFCESKTIMQNTAKKIVVIENNDKYKSMLDENYDAFKLKGDENGI